LPISFGPSVYFLLPSCPGAGFDNFFPVALCVFTSRYQKLELPEQSLRTLPVRVQVFPRISISLVLPPQHGTCTCPGSFFFLQPGDFLTPHRLFNHNPKYCFVYPRSVTNSWRVFLCRFYCPAGIQMGLPIFSTAPEPASSSFHGPLTAARMRNFCWYSPVPPHNANFS